MLRDNIMSSISNIKTKYSNYQSQECNFKDNTANPERCPASKAYVSQMNDFINKTIEQSIEQTKKLKPNEISGKSVYPKVNYMFDYQTAVRKDYNPYQLGITNKPTLDNLLSAPVSLDNYKQGLFVKAFPNNSTVAGETDVINEDTERVTLLNSLRIEDETLPYPSFRKDYPECRYPTKGTGSSSYFIKTGICKTKITDPTECRTKGYNWVEKSTFVPQDVKAFYSTMSKTDDNLLGDKPKISPQGVCYKPRYSYINNQSKGIINGYDGLVPSFFNDLEEISPMNLFEMTSGYSVDGNGQLPCIDN